MKRSLTSVLVLAALVGFTHFNCATRWREASSGRSADEVGQMLKSLNTVSGVSNATVAEAIKLVEDHPDDVIVYFSEAPGAMGPIDAVTPIDFSFVNKDIGIGSVTSIRVFFIDLLSDGGNLNYLLVDYVVKGQSGHQVAAFTNKGAPALGLIEDGEFTSVLKGDNGNYVTVRSFDVDADNGDLNDVIQLELSGADNQYNETDVNLGQISSMEGFSSFF